MKKKLIHLTTNVMVLESVYIPLKSTVTLQV